MECRQCGAELRPGARFCNRCGALQAEGAPEPQPAQAALAAAATGAGPRPTQAPATSPDEAPDAGPGQGDEAQRMKRPPRVTRSREGAESAIVRAADEGAAAAPEPAAPAEDAGDEGDAQSPPASPPASQAQDGAAQGSPAAVPAGASPLAGQEGAVYLADGLPWPLSPGMIVGGRYRIQSLIQAAPTQAEENVYRVTDLQGYERCWSCGAEHEAPEGQAPERFCQQCGADMLARAYVMRERIEADEAPPAGDVADGGASGDTQPALPVDAAQGAPAGEGERAFRQGTRAFRVALEEGELPLFPAGARLEIAAATDIGRDRAAGHNEDSTGYFALETAHDSISEPLALCVVADGLGGHASGREASRIVVRTLLEHVLRHVALPLVGLLTDAPSTEEGLKHVLRDGIAEANAALAKANDELKVDMGSTVVAALIFEETAFIANVGDSRAYVLEGEALRRVTTDHSLVEQLIAGGIIGAEDRYTHPQRNQIFRSLGGGTNAEVDVFTQRLRPGMRILLCSDGLWEMVHDDEIARALRETADPQAACDALVRAANGHGGEDNISALLIEVGG